jgi:hypothetical protein
MELPVLMVFVLLKGVVVIVVKKEKTGRKGDD